MKGLKVSEALTRPKGSYKPSATNELHHAMKNKTLR